MKCHYEVLGIERNADNKTIKNGKLFQVVNAYEQIEANLKFQRIESWR